jgi:hypothetical protein
VDTLNPLRWVRTLPTYTVVCFLPDAMIPPATGSPSPMPDSRACAAAATAKGGGA